VAWSDRGSHLSERLPKPPPPSVFLAPYATMDAMIALAAPGRLLALGSLDEEKVREFIIGNLDR